MNILITDRSGHLAIHVADQVTVAPDGRLVYFDTQSHKWQKVLAGETLQIEIKEE